MNKKEKRDKKEKKRATERVKETTPPGSFVGEHGGIVVPFGTGGRVSYPAGYSGRLISGGGGGGIDPDDPKYGRANTYTPAAPIALEAPVAALAAGDASSFFALLAAQVIMMSFDLLRFARVSLSPSSISPSFPQSGSDEANCWNTARDG